MTKRIISLSVVSLALALLSAGCEPAGGPSSGSSHNGDNDGQISFELTLGSGLRFDKVNWSITGQGLQRTGSIDVGASPTISAVVENIPFGRDYVARLTAMDLDHRVSSCEGTSTFDVTGGPATAVAVHLVCKEAGAVEPARAPVPPATKYVLGVALALAGATMLRRRDRRA